MSDATDEMVRRLIAAAAGGGIGVAAIVKFDMGADGVIVIDGRSLPTRITTADEPADCTIRIGMSFLRQAVYGEQSCGATFMRFVRAIDGPSTLAVRIQPFLRRAAAAAIGA